MAIDYKKELEKELTTLVEELKSVGRRNPSNPNDWEARPANIDTDSADENLVADSLGALEGNNAILGPLEDRYNEVLAAIKRFDEGTFGKCEVCKKDIEEKRLEANPAATTCMEHMKK